MGQIVGLKAKPKRCNLNKVSQLGIPAAGEYILVSYDNSMTANGQGNFDRYIIGDGRTAATALELKYLDDSTRPYIVEEVNKAVADIQPIEITGDVTNAPDEEDLTSENQGGTDVLKFKDKAYNSALYSGLGRTYLRKNIVTLEGTGKNVLTQAMVNTANTIYHIQYDYDLNGQTITLPAGCVLEFDGGSVKNGTLVGSGTKIIASDGKIFDTMTFGGSFIGAMNALWIGATPNDQSFDNAVILRKWINEYSGIFNTIEFPESDYYFLTPTAMSGDLRNRKIDGCSSNFYVNIPDDGNGDGQTFLKITGESFTLQNVNISNTRKTIVNDTEYNLTKTCCLEFNKAQLFTLHEVAIYYFDKAITLVDVWYGGFSGRASLMSNRICIFAKAGDSIEVNTIDFSNVRCRGVNAETAQAVWAQESGESADNYALRIASCGVDFHCLSNNCKFNGMVIEGFDYGIRFNYMPRATSGSQRCLVNIQSCYFEANRTYDIYIGIGYVINPLGLNSYLYMLADVCIIGCLFHTLKKAYFDNSQVTMLGCSGQCNVILNGTFTSSGLLYDTESAQSSSLFAHCISRNNLVYNKNGALTGSIGSMRDALATLEKNNFAISVLTDPYAIDTTLTNINRDSGKIANQFTIGMNPEMRMQDIIMPMRLSYDRTKNKMTAELNGRNISVNYYGAVRTTLKALGDSIPLYEFLRRWDAGIAYAGCVDNLFSYKVNANPSTGLITRDSDGTIVGVGRVAIAAGTYPTSVSWFIDVDTMLLVRFSYSYAKFAGDLVQCGRNYREILPDVDSSPASTNTMQYKVSEANRNLYVAKRINAICYNTTSARYEIYNGFEWVALTNRWQRYTYNDNGKSISERATMADFEGQTFLNKATGIVYTFEMNADKTTSKWRTSVGSVDSLEHPNGYHATSNPLDYLTEMNVGECVNYNGDILTLSTKRQQESQITVAARVDSSTPSRASHANTLQGGKRYWVGYSIKQSWGGRMIFRKTSSVEATDTDEIVILSNFNETTQGKEFVAPDPSEYPYIFVENRYSLAEVLTFEVYVPRWLEQDGATAGVLRHGATADRPAATDIYVGFEYFDETLGKPIYWNGTAWADATGTAV